MPDWGFWLLVALAFAAAEMATVSFFSLFFSLGALIALAASFFIASWSLQAVVFVVASVILFWLIRPSLTKVYKQDRVKTAVEGVVGRVGTVIADIDNTEGVGQIKAEGEVWTARSLTGEPIAKDTRVEIVSIEGVKAVVKKKED